MAKTKIAEWDGTAGNNTDIDSINIDEGMDPSAVNNALREAMEQIANHFAQDSVADSGTPDLGAKAAHYLTLAGTTTITAFGTIKAGTLKFLKFDGARTLTHNATSLILPGGANITTAASDTAVAVSLGSGNWRVLSYQRAGTAPYKTPTKQTFTSSGTWTKPAGCVAVEVWVLGPGGGGGGATGGSSQTSVGGGGGAGEFAREYIASGLGATETVTVGTGGAGGAVAATPNAGSNGSGASSFGSHLSAGAGSGGSAITAGANAVPIAGGAGGDGGTGGDVHAKGQSGFTGIRLSGTNSLSGAGGSSALGGGGAAVVTSDSNGVAGEVGGGGSGACSITTAQRAGGDGGNGIVIVWEYY